MLLKPLSVNVFYAALVVTTLLLVSAALAKPVFGDLLASAEMQDWLRQVVVPMLTA